jgi:nucleoside phosphorylase
MIVCAGDIEQFDFAKSIGIGLVNVAMNLTELCLKEKPKSLTFVGTAGSYGKKNIFDIVESTVAVNIENSFFSNSSYTPLDSKVESLTNVSRETIVNSSNYITTDNALGEYYLKENIDLENMEFFAVMKVAEKFNIPAKGIFVVTNYCNKNAHKDFLNNRIEAMAMLSGYVCCRKI